MTDYNIIFEKSALYKEYVKTRVASVCNGYKLVKFIRYYTRVARDGSHTFEFRIGRCF